jgi:ribosomal protein L7/L12
MESFEPYQLWLAMAAVAYVGFLLGRVTKGASPEERQRRRMAEELEIETAMAGLDASKLEEVDRLMTDGKKIEAIKILRAATGLGLKLSKTAVERRMSGR